LTNSRVLKLSSGDIVIFYRTKDQQRITSIGIVDKFYPRKSDLEEILRIIGKRSVYSSNEIENFKKPLSVILFRHQLYLKKFVTLSELQNAGIISWPPQSISEIDDSKYFWIKKHGGIDENLTLH